MRFTVEQYEAAIAALSEGKRQLEPDGGPCAIVLDGREYDSLPTDEARWHVLYRKGYRVKRARLTIVERKARAW